MRRIPIFIAIALVCLILAGCDIFVWKKYYNPEYKISMLLPRSWEIDEEAKTAALVVYIPQDNPKARFKGNMRMVVQDLPAEIPLSSYYDVNREELLSVFPKHSNIAEGQGMSRLVRYQWIAFNAQIAEDIRVRAINAAWIKGKRVYLLTCVIDLSSAVKVEPLFRKILSSFRL